MPACAWIVNLAQNAACVRIRSETHLRLLLNVRRVESVNLDHLAAALSGAQLQNRYVTVHLESENRREGTLHRMLLSLNHMFCAQDEPPTLMLKEQALVTRAMMRMRGVGRMRVRVAF